MAVGPIGGVIYANQNTHLPAIKQSNYQNRVDLQNLAASEIANDKSKDVREVRAAEELHKIDPEKEHEKKKSEEEENERQEGKPHDKEEEKAPEEGQSTDTSKTHILDIQA